LDDGNGICAIAPRGSTGAANAGAWESDGFIGKTPRLLASGKNAMVERFSS